MRIRVFGGAASAARAAARVVARQLQVRPTSVLGLPTGRTSVPIYEHLARLRVDFSRAVTFNVDEFVGVRSEDEQSFRAFMNRHLFRHINLPARRVNFLDGSASDLDSECARFERAIARAGGIDLMLLGIGVNGHVGFNEPDDDLVARTHRTRLTLATRRANRWLFGGRLDRVPRQGLSMGIGTILSARAIVLAATGRSKSRAVGRMLGTRVTPRVPASFLQLHPDVRLMLDRAAAAHLPPGAVR